ncbi:MAG: hypothetical protein CL882_00995 [Dehalococcoidia bacterium]|nr:hypothetical protein [Dehalococcoidia bacterium]
MVSLANIKFEEKLQDTFLVKNSKLSFQPVTKEQIDYICSLAKG